MRIRLWMAAFAMLVIVSALPSNSAAREPGLLFAHRGGAHEFDENTLEAFRSSYEAGLRGFETDVRMSKDGALVILHDDSLDRTYSGTGPVEHKSAAELRTMTSKKTGQKLLFLDELLAFFADKPGVYLELEMKTGNEELYPDARLQEYVGKLYETVVVSEPKGSTYVCTSFDKRPLKLIKALDASADLLFITGGPCSAEVVRTAQALGVKRIGVRVDMSSRAAVREAQEAGLRVNGWPGHNLQDYHLAVGLGVDGICTDVPVAIQTWKDKHERPAQKERGQ